MVCFKNSNLESLKISLQRYHPTKVTLYDIQRKITAKTKQNKRKQQQKKIYKTLL